MSLTFVQGDTAPDIQATLHQEDDLSVLTNLTGCTVRFQMRRPDDKRYQVSALATVIDALTGKVAYSWGPNDLSVPGTFFVQWEVTYPSGRVQTTAQETEITVRRQ